MSLPRSKAPLRVLVSVLLAGSIANAAALPHPGQDATSIYAEIEDLPLVDEVYEAAAAAGIDDPENLFKDISEEMNSRTAYEVFMEFLARLFGPRNDGDEADTTTTATVFVTPTPTSNIVFTPGSHTTSTNITTTDIPENDMMSILPVGDLSSAINATFLTPEFFTAPETISVPSSSAIPFLPPFPLNATFSTSVLATAVSITGEFSVTIPTLPTSTGVSSPLTWSFNFSDPIFTPSFILTAPILPTAISNAAAALNTTSTTVSLTSTTIVTETITPVPVLGTGSIAPVSAGTGAPIAISELPIWFNSTLAKPTVIIGTAVSAPISTGTGAPIAVSESPIWFNSTIVVPPIIIGTGISAPISAGTASPIAISESPIFPNTTIIGALTQLPVTVTGLPGAVVNFSVTIPLPLFPNTTVTIPAVLLSTGVSAPSSGAALTLAVSEEPIYFNTTTTIGTAPTFLASAGTGRPILSVTDEPLFPNVTTATSTDLTISTATDVLGLPPLETPDTDDKAIEFPGLLALRAICKDPAIRIVTLPLLNRFYGPSAYPSLFAFPGCTASNPQQALQAPGLMNCTALGAEVQRCQARGKRVLLTVKGDGAGVVGGNTGFGNPNTAGEPFGPHFEADGGIDKRQIGGGLLGITLPKISIPSISLSKTTISIPAISLPKTTISIPAITLPKLELPTLELPKITLPAVSTVHVLSTPTVVVSESSTHKHKVSTPTSGLSVPATSIVHVSTPTVQVSIPAIETSLLSISVTRVSRPTVDVFTPVFKLSLPSLDLPTAIIVPPTALFEVPTPKFDSIIKLPTPIFDPDFDFDTPTALFDIPKPTFDPSINLPPPIFDPLFDFDTPTALFDVPKPTFDSSISLPTPIFDPDFDFATPILDPILDFATPIIEPVIDFLSTLFDPEIPVPTPIIDSENEYPTPFDEPISEPPTPISEPAFDSPTPEVKFSGLALDPSVTSFIKLPTLEPIPLINSSVSVVNPKLDSDIAVPTSFVLLSKTLLDYPEYTPISNSSSSMTTSVVASSTPSSKVVSATSSSVAHVFTPSLVYVSITSSVSETSTVLPSATSFSISAPILNATAPFLNSSTSILNDDTTSILNDDTTSILNDDTTPALDDTAPELPSILPAPVPHGWLPPSLNATPPSIFIDTILPEPTPFPMPFPISMSSSDSALPSIPNLFDAMHPPSALALTLSSLFGETHTERADLRPLGPDAPVAFVDPILARLQRPLGEEVVVDGFDVQLPAEWKGTYQEEEFEALVKRLKELSAEAWEESGGVKGGPGDLGADGPPIVTLGWIGGGLKRSEIAGEARRGERTEWNGEI